MKKTVSLLMALMLILLLAFTAVSCGRKSDPPQPAPEPGTTGEPGKQEEPGKEDPGKQEEPGGEESPETDGVSPLLWRVTDGDGHTLYLFGTIHVGDQRNDAVLERLAPVLESCGKLAVEFDVVAYSEDMQQMMMDMTQYVLTDGSVVSDYMPEELYQRSYALLEQAKMFPAIYAHYNLAWWSQLVETAMMTVYSDLDSEKAMDSLLIGRAYEKEMPVLSVESGEFQMTLLNSFDPELYVLMIEETLKSAETFKDDLNEMYALWLSGDREAFWTYLAGENEEDGDYTDEQIALLEDYNRKLLDERNLGMRDKAMEYLTSGDTVFFAVGAAHMANDAGLVQLLTDAGCTVEEIQY